MFFNDKIYRCPYCGELSSNFIVCKKCAISLNRLVNFTKLKTKYCDELTAPFIYDSIIREAILNFKFDRYFDNCESFAFFMKNCDIQRPDLVVGVPCFNNKKKFKISKLLTSSFARSAKLKYSFMAVQKIRSTKLQHECGLEQRLSNLKDAFQANSWYVESKSVLICDDIITSGATVNELAKSLKQAGAARVSAIAIAVSKIILKHDVAQIIDVKEDIIN